MSKPVKFTAGKPPKSPRTPAFDTSFDFGLNVGKKSKGGGKKKKPPAGGGS